MLDCVDKAAHAIQQAAGVADCVGAPPPRNFTLLPHRPAGGDFFVLQSPESSPTIP